MTNYDVDQANWSVGDTVTDLDTGISYIVESGSPGNWSLCIAPSEDMDNQTDADVPLSAFEVDSDSPYAGATNQAEHNAATRECIASLKNGSATEASVVRLSGNGANYQYLDNAGDVTESWVNRDEFQSFVESASIVPAELDNATLQNLGAGFVLYDTLELTWANPSPHRPAAVTATAQLGSVLMQMVEDNYWQIRWTTDGFSTPLIGYDTRDLPDGDNLMKTHAYMPGFLSDSRNLQPGESFTWRVNILINTGGNNYVPNPENLLTPKIHTITVSANLR